MINLGIPEGPSRRPWIISVVVLGAGILVALGILWTRQAYPPQSSELKTTPGADAGKGTDLAAEPVRVPLQFNNGGYSIPASWGGRSVLSLVDTGTAPISWDERFTFSGFPVGPGKPENWSRSPTISQPVLMPFISIGGYKLSNVVTRRTKAAGTFLAQAAEPILGMDVFRDAAFSIDVRRRLFTIWRQGQIPRPQYPDGPRRSFPIKWNTAGLPMVQGRIFGQPGWFVLDTGADVSALSARFAARFPRLGTHTGDQIAGVGGMTVVQTLPKLDLKLGDFNMTVSPGKVIPRDDGDAFLGRDFLRGLILTMDAPRSEMTLEPDGFAAGPRT